MVDDVVIMSYSISHGSATAERVFSPNDISDRQIHVLEDYMQQIPQIHACIIQ